MRILVLGATGATGRLLVSQALARGHAVTAFVRSRAKLEGVEGDLRLVEGGITDRAAVSAALRGQDAVVSTLGAKKPWRPSPDIVQGVGVVITAMKAIGVDRVVYMSALGVGESRGAVRGSVLRLMIPLMLKAAFADHAVDEQALRDSGLAWTIVRPTLLTNGAPTGRWLGGPDVRDPFPLGRIPRADVAAFMLNAIDRGEDVRKAVNLVGPQAAKPITSAPTSGGASRARGGAASSP